MSLLARYVQGAGALTAQAVIQRLLGMITSIVLARSLGAGGFGTYSAVINTASSAYGLVSFGVDAAVHVFTADRPDQQAASTGKAEILGAGLLLLSIAGVVA